MKKKGADEDMDCEETVKLKDFNEDQKNTVASGGTKEYNSDGEQDDDPRMRGGGARECRTQ